MPTTLSPLYYFLKPPIAALILSLDTVFTLQPSGSKESGVEPNPFSPTPLKSLIWCKLLTDCLKPVDFDYSASHTVVLPGLTL